MAGPAQSCQALCFVHAGGEDGERSAIHDLAATALVAVRSGLQDLKHSDKGTADERKEIAASDASVESIFLLTCKLAWPGIAEDQLADIKNQLAAA